MIRIRLIELMASKSFADGSRVDLGAIAEATGIHRTTLSKIANIRGYNLSASNADRLCRFFNCGVGDLMEYIPDEDVPGVLKKSFMGAQAKTPAARAGAVARHGSKKSAD
jgi:DNA-binding Xre family transcriptional regulator